MGVGLEERTLRRIIATLVALAVLAERAALRSFPVRWLVLSILRYAETVALGYVAETTGMDWSCFQDDPEAGSSPGDAAILAWRFRTLAALLGALLRPEGRLDGWTTGLDAAQQGLASCAFLSLVMLGGWQPAFYDTS